MSTLLSLVTLTNMHIGTPGSAINVVDNPVYRDSLGRIVIRGESLKGAVRSALFFIFKKICNDNTLAQYYLDCFLGSMESMSALSILDAPLIFIPTTALRFKVLYVTSPELLLRFILLSDDVLSNNVRRTLDNIVSHLADIGINEVYLYPPLEEQILDFAKDISLNINQNSNLIKPIYDLLASILKNTEVNDILNPYGLAVVSDDIFNQICDRSLFIRPRIKIKGLDKMDGDIEVYSKRVNESIGTWFEEEIPKFSVFITKFKATITGDLELPIPKDEKGIEREEMIQNILNITSLVSIRKGNLISVKRDTLLHGIIKHINTMYIGGNEALNKGLVRIIPIQLLKISSPTLPQKKNRKQALTLIVEKNIKQLMDLVKLIGGNIGAKAKEIQGKFNALPERIKQLGLIATYLFYTRLKSDVSGKGYAEANTLLKKFTREKLDKEEFIAFIDDNYSRIDPSKIREYLMISENAIRGLTVMKYIIRSYVKGGE